jgi:hypothetical protein
MQKMLIIMAITLIANNIFAFQDLESTPCTLIHDHANVGFLDAAENTSSRATYEAIDAEDALPGIEEYDRHVTDASTAPKVSAIEVALQKMVGTLIIHYISLRESARIHFHNIKNVITHWYHNIIK